MDVVEENQDQNRHQIFLDSWYSEWITVYVYLIPRHYTSSLWPFDCATISWNTPLKNTCSNMRERYSRSHIEFLRSEMVNQIQCSEKIMRCLSRLFFKHIRTSSNSPAMAPANMTIDYNKSCIVIRLQSGHMQWLLRRDCFRMSDPEALSVIGIT